MFKCQATGRMSKPNEPSRKLVTHVRNKTYYRWNHKKGEPEITGHGTEIVRELTVSKDFYDEVMASGKFQPEVVREKD